MGHVALYDEFSADYDRFVDWAGRLQVELPFIEERLLAVGARRVLDAACGTGAHALALAERGYQVIGADPSTGMIDRARQVATDRGLDVDFVVAGFGQMAALAGNSFDAVLCLGNSLPHALSSESLQDTLLDWASCLRSGGLLLIQNRNFDAIVSQSLRWTEPQSHREGDEEWIFLRFYDFVGDGLLNFHVVTLHRRDLAEWEQRISSTQLRPILRADLLEALQKSHFDHGGVWGDMQGQLFAEVRSPNLVIAATRSASTFR